MNNFSIKNSLNVTLLDFKKSKKNIIGWSIGIFSIMFLYMILFPSMNEMAQAEMNSMPKELTKLMGMDSFSSLANFITYYGMIYNIILIAISIFAVTFSANLIMKEEKTQSIEFLYSMPVSRLEIYVSKVITSFLAVLLIVLCAIISSLLCGFINGGETFVLSDFILISKISSFTAFFFISISIFLSGASSKINGSIVGSFAVLLTYMFGYLGKLLNDNGKFLLKISPFEAFSPSNALNLQNETVLLLILYLSIMIILVIIGGLLYNKRDFK